MQEQERPRPTQEEVDAETAALAKDWEQYNLRRKQDDADSIVMSNRITASNQVLADLQKRTGDLAVKQALVAEDQEKVKYLLDFKQWVLNYLQARSPANLTEGIHYKVITRAALDAKVQFPTKDKGDHFENCAKQVNTFLNNASYVVENPIVRKTRGGYYRTTVKGATVQPQSLAQTAPVNPNDPPIVIVEGGPKYISNHAFKEVVDLLVPVFQGATRPLDYNGALNLFRDLCYSPKVNVWFKGKEKIFEHFFFTLCAPGGPLECWQKKMGLGADTTSTRELYQKAGGPMPSEAGEWKKVTPAVIPLPVSMKRRVKATPNQVPPTMPS